MNRALKSCDRISTEEVDLTELSDVMEAVSQNEKRYFDGGIWRLKAQLLVGLERYEKWDELFMAFGTGKAGTPAPIRA
jgi:hypothetical protein